MVEIKNAPREILSRIREAGRTISKKMSEEVDNAHRGSRFDYFQNLRLTPTDPEEQENLIQRFSEIVSPLHVKQKRALFEELSIRARVAREKYEIAHGKQEGISSKLLDRRIDLLKDQIETELGLKPKK